MYAAYAERRSHDDSAETGNSDMGSHPTRMADYSLQVTRTGRYIFARRCGCIPGKRCPVLRFPELNLSEAEPITIPWAMLITDMLSAGQNCSPA